MDESEAEATSHKKHFRASELPAKRTTTKTRAKVRFLLLAILQLHRSIRSQFKGTA